MNSNTVAAIGAFISNITGNIAGQQAQLETLKEIQVIAEQGWQSDQATIEKGITDGIAAQLPAAVATQTETLTTERDSAVTQLAAAQGALTTEQEAHQTDNTSHQTVIDGLTAQIAAVIKAAQDTTLADDTARLNAVLAALSSSETAPAETTPATDTQTVPPQEQTQ